MKHCLVSAAIVLVFASAAGAEVRTWKSADGKFSIKAKLVSFADEKAVLQKMGEQLVVPLASLSDADRQYVKQRALKLASGGSADKPEVRTWASADGKFTIEARMAGSAAGKVTLLKGKPQRITVPLAALSQPDQEYLLARNGKLAEAEPAEGEPAEEEVGPSGARTCTMKLVRMKAAPTGLNSSDTIGVQVFRASRPQQFQMLIRQGQTSNTGEKAFSAAVQTQPSEYLSEHPLRGVARVGLKQFGFVLDAAPEKSSKKSSSKKSDEEESDPKPQGYGRLFFDVNGNGDLTDDEVILAEKPKGRLPSGYSRFEFPRIDLSFDADGTQVEYAFFMSGYSQGSSSYTLASASLYPAVYREGTITVASKRRRMILVDANANGQFDDRSTVRRSTTGRVYPSFGDKLLIDPKPASSSSSGSSSQYVSKLATINNRLYDLEIAPAGDKLTLTPSSVSTGTVTSPCDGLQVVLFGDHGVVQIDAEKSKPTALPVGTWNLAQYRILQGSLTGSTASRGRTSVLSAQPTADCKPIEVAEGETVELPYAGPYKPVVTASSVRPGQTARLSLSLVGAAGEKLTALTVNGSSPKKPEFTIRGPDGKKMEIEEPNGQKSDVGKFEWG